MLCDNAPVKETCPLIDDVKSVLFYLNDGETPDIKDALDLLEKIRDANSKLREWGNEQYNRAEDLEKEYEHKKGQLEGEIKDLTKEVEELQEEVYDLKQEIREMNGQ